jgi:hypothetical protein
MSQIDYSEEDVEEMVGRVLVKSGVVFKDNNTYTIPGFAELTNKKWMI